MSEELDILQEVDATLGSPNKGTDATNPAGGSPSSGKASKNKKVDAKADEIEKDEMPAGEDGEPDELKVKAKGSKSKEPAPNVGMKEEIDAMFESHDLSEDFKSKAAVVFEAAVNNRVSGIREQLEEEFDNNLTEQAGVILEELTDKVDKYLDYVVEKWMVDNEVAIENGIRTEMAESFMSSLHELMSEHHIDLPEEKVDVVAEMAAELQEKEDKLEEAVSKIVDLKRELAEEKREDVIANLSESLTATQREKLEKLSEGVEYDNIEQFEEKVKIIKEHYFGTVKEESGDDVDPIDESSKVVHMDDAMSRYTAAIKRSLKK